MTDHKELRRLAAAATPGPWTVVNSADGKPHHILGMFNGNLLDPVVDCKWASGTQRGVDDYTFIAAANPKAVTALLDELTGLQKDYSNLDRELNEKLADSKRRHEITERQAGYMAETLGGRLEKAEAERDQLRGQLAEEFAKGAREGWMRAHVYNVDIDAEADPEVIAQMESRWPLATPHTAATPVQEHYFVHPSATLTPEEFATEIAKFNEAARDAKPMDIKAIDAQLRAADSVQVRTPGTIEVCELCKVPIAGFFNDGCWRTNHPTAPCPIRPKGV